MKIFRYAHVDIVRLFGGTTLLLVIARHHGSSLQSSSCTWLVLRAFGRLFDFIDHYVTRLSSRLSWSIPELGPKQRVPVRKQMLLKAAVDRIAPAVGKGLACLSIVPVHTLP